MADHKKYLKANNSESNDRYEILGDEMVVRGHSAQTSHLSKMNTAKKGSRDGEPRNGQTTPDELWLAAFWGKRGLSLQKGPSVHSFRVQKRLWTPLGDNSGSTAAKLTGIICTIGPSSNNVSTLIKMIEAGMNIARLNFSHGNYEYHTRSIENVREATRIVNERIAPANISVAIALDTKGPEIRTGLLLQGPTAKIELKKGQTVTISTEDGLKDACSEEKLYVDYKNIAKTVVVGDRIFIDDGIISLMALDVQVKEIKCVVENGGLLGSKKRVNLPGLVVDLPVVSEQDVADLRFGLKHKVDMVFASFVRSSAAIDDIKNVLGPEGKDILIISKIENLEGCEKADEIIAVSDGIMVARGDLGIEIPVQKVFLVQKVLITKCNMVGKPVICATQMLESMTKKPRPTQVESCDAANAVLDGADCVMLSGETAEDDYLIQTIETMTSVCLEVEDLSFYRKEFYHQFDLATTTSDRSNALAVAAVAGSTACLAKAIIVICPDGKMINLVCKYRPHCPVIALTESEQLARQLLLYRAVLPLLYNGSRFENLQDIAACIEFAIQTYKQRGLLLKDDFVVSVTDGPMLPKAMCVLPVP